MISAVGTLARDHPGEFRMSDSQNRKTISAKVDHATYDAFNAACKSLGTNANALLTEFIVSVVDGERRAARASLSAEPSGETNDAQVVLYLNEILKHARIASLMTAGVAEQIDKRLWENALADVEKEAARFVRRLDTISSAPGGAGLALNRRETRL